MVIEFSDFFALLQPSANVSMVGRLPGVLETVRYECIFIVVIFPGDEFKQKQSYY